MDEYKEKVVRERSEGDHESWRDNQFGLGLPYIWPELGPVSVLGAWQLCTRKDGSVWIGSSALGILYLSFRPFSFYHFIWLVRVSVRCHASAPGTIYRGARAPEQVAQIAQVYSMINGGYEDLDLKKWKPVGHLSNYKNF
jgi:hypothetical protein